MAYIYSLTIEFFIIFFLEGFARNKGIEFLYSWRLTNLDYLNIEYLENRGAPNQLLTEGQVNGHVDCGRQAGDHVDCGRQVFEGYGYCLLENYHYYWYQEKTKKFKFVLESMIKCFGSVKLHTI